MYKIEYLIIFNHLLFITNNIVTGWVILFMMIEVNNVYILYYSYIYFYGCLFTVWYFYYLIISLFYEYNIELYWIAFIIFVR